MKNNIKKRLVIGDIHGHIEPFKTIYEKEDPDDVIILGDYFDSFHGSDEEIINCFKTIVKMKKNHTKGEFVMLIGNHDFHYMDLSEHYSGKRKSYELAVSTLLDNERENLQYFYIDDINKTVYSHAGIMNAWLSENRLFINDLHDLENIDESKFKFTFRGGDSGFGDGPYASPIWVRPSTLVEDMYKDESGWIWTQIVGHTSSKTSRIYCGKSMEKQLGSHSYKYSQDANGLLEQYELPEWPFLYVVDSMPYYYIIEEIDSISEKLIYREVKSNNINGKTRTDTVNERINELYKLVIEKMEKTN